MADRLMKEDVVQQEDEHERRREHRRLRFRRHGRRAFLRSVYALPSLATLGNAICGFGAMYVAGINPTDASPDRLFVFLQKNAFMAAAYLIFLAMVFDGLDGRLARFTRHTTDFGGQLDSLADVISFGAAPAFLALQLFHVTFHGQHLPVMLTRLVWATGAVFMSCAAIRLARFNVSNEHGEQHHYSFLGLPSPGAGGCIAAFVLMQQTLAGATGVPFLEKLALVCVWMLPVLLLSLGLLMVSAIRYPHLINRYLRGKRSLWRLIALLALALLIVVAHQYVVALGTIIYALWGPVSLGLARWRSKSPPTPAAPAAPME